LNSLFWNSVDWSSAVVAGNAPPASRIFTPSVTSANLRKAYARFLLVLAAGIVRELPPFSAVAFAPASHWGMGATRHLPEPDFTPDSMLAGIHAPVIRVAIWPLAIPLNQPSLQEMTGASSFPLISCCQAEVNFWVPGSAKFTVTLVPSTWYGLPPACQIMLVVKPASPTSAVM